MLPDIRYRDPAVTNLPKLLIKKTQQDDGHTNRLGKQIIDEIKDYLRHSFYYLIALVAIKNLFFETETWDAEGVFSEFTDSYVYGRIARTMSRLVDSLASQRRLFRQVKIKLRFNEIDRKWYDALHTDVVKSNERVTTIYRILEADLKLTPFVYYTEGLSEQGLTVEQDIQRLLSKYSTTIAYGDDIDDVKEEVAQHIVGVMKSVHADEALFEKIRTNSQCYNEYLKKQQEARKREKEAQKIADLTNKQEQAQEELFAAMSNMTPILARSYSKNGLHQCFEKYGDKAYMVMSKRILKTKPLGHQVLYLSAAGTMTSDITQGKKFSSYQEAKEAMQGFLEQKQSYVCEIATLDFSNWAYKERRKRA